MKKLLVILYLIPTLLIVQAQPNTLDEKYKTEQKSEAGYTYETVANDPLNARIYTLENGLKVYLSVYKDAPRIQTYIAVRAGSKNDPPHATGLAHYLEHILFKGTSKIGTSDWEKEKVELDKIEKLYEVYRQTKDEKEREKLYRQIDSISLVAASYAIANEYDKMVSNIGASGTNAYTFLEQTVYVNDIPSNQIEKWAEIEAERFSEVVPRLFHTELEAVYEEKNKGLDNDRRKVWEATLEGLFQKHSYGTQTTIGTVEHLKNPSITEIKKYFDKYYVPNNMAICMSGDFNPDEVIKIIDKNFGKLKAKPVEPFIAPKEDPIISPVVKEVFGPDAENVTLAYRFDGSLSKSKDPYYIQLISMLLTNGQAGLMDLNLNQKQKVLGAYSYSMTFNDYSFQILAGRPREGQKLEDVKALLLSQIDSIKNGKFDDWLLKAVINDYKMKKMKEYESNRLRADAFVNAFIGQENWADYVKEVDILESISKEELVDFAQKHYSENYVVVYKRQGTDTTIQKVPKPKISPVPVNREMQSEFYNQVMNKPSPSIEPVFIDYNKDLTSFTAKNKLPVIYKQNKENDLFDLYLVWEIGKRNDPRYALAASYLNYLGTKKYSAEELKKEFYKLGTSFSVSMNDDATYIQLTGLNENFSKALALLESLLKDPKPDQQALNDFIDGILKSRADNKLSKDAILKSAMVNYAMYGKESPFTNILSTEELKQTTAEQLTNLIKSLGSFKHRVLYYGPETSDGLNKKLSAIHKPSGFKAPPAPKEFPRKDFNENVVYFVDYDMVQAELIFLSKSVPYDKTLVPSVALYNEYFGGGMGSLVFQEMRESKALAYAVYSVYANASKKEHPNYITSYIGTQADKLDEAVEGMNQLLEDMPQSEVLFKNAKAAIIENISSQRVTKSGVILDYERAQKLGLDTDIRKDIYNRVLNMEFKDIKTFHEKYIKGQQKVMLVVGSKDRINFEDLSKYGKVIELSKEEIFGY
ncbi:MAG TPA: insulinase family protein [Cytophagaceae bacterium]